MISRSASGRTASDSSASTAAPPERTSGSISNFGGNICFQPRHRYLPRSEKDVLRILDGHRNETVRAIGAGHSWNPGIETSDVLLDLRHLRRIRICDDRTRVVVGAGCRIAELLAHSRPTRADPTLHRAHRPPDLGPGPSPPVPTARDSTPCPTTSSPCASPATAQKGRRGCARSTRARSFGRPDAPSGRSGSCWRSR